MTHCEPVGDRDSSRWILGIAIATIVWSMNVIATANTIAASTRFLLAAPPDRDATRAPGMAVISPLLQVIAPVASADAWSVSRKPHCNLPQRRYALAPRITCFRVGWRLNRLHLADAIELRKPPHDQPNRRNALPLTQTQMISAVAERA